VIFNPCFGGNRTQINKFRKINARNRTNALSMDALNHYKDQTKGNVKTVDSDVENERKQPNWLAMNPENKTTKPGTDIREEIMNFDLWLFLLCSSQLHYSKEDLFQAPIRKLKNLKPSNAKFV